jgi:hypothetical protein
MISLRKLEEQLDRHRFGRSDIPFPPWGSREKAYRSFYRYVCKEGDFVNITRHERANGVVHFRRRGYEGAYRYANGYPLFDGLGGIPAIRRRWESECRRKYVKHACSRTEADRISGMIEDRLASANRNFMKKCSMTLQLSEMSGKIKLTRDFLALVDEFHRARKIIKKLTERR